MVYDTIRADMLEVGDRIRLEVEDAVVLSIEWPDSDEIALITVRDDLDIVHTLYVDYTDPIDLVM